MEIKFLKNTVSKGLVRFGYSGLQKKGAVINLNKPTRLGEDPDDFARSLIKQGFAKEVKKPVKKEVKNVKK